MNHVCVARHVVCVTCGVTCGIEMDRYMYAYLRKYVQTDLFILKWFFMSIDNSIYSGVHRYIHTFTFTNTHVHIHFATLTKCSSKHRDDDKHQIATITKNSETPNAEINTAES